jgi:hypothetical protein
MELLLNLVWITISLSVFCAFVTRRRSPAWVAQVPYVRALLALACGVVLLFPIVSASDDLHPVQAVLEDASKRVQQAVGSVSPTRVSSRPSILPSLLAIYLLFACSALWPWRPRTLVVRVPSRDRIPPDGRAPPSVH